MSKTKINIFSISISMMLPFLGKAQQGASEEEIKRANNPLANSKAFNFQNYYVPSIYESADFKANTFLMRYSQPFAGGKILMRATLPFVTVPTGFDSQGAKYSSGMGDLNFFATYTFSKPGAKTLLGVGPQVVIPTATSTNTGSGKWQLGGAFVAFNASSPTFQWGSLITYQASIAGQSDRVNTSLLNLQPFALFQLGKGTYLRSSAICSFNLEASSYNVPFGIGFGQVAKSGNVVFNIFLEPQFTLLHQGAGQPALQVFGGINCQF
jgi:hypothetical protein